MYLYIYVVIYLRIYVVIHWAFESAGK